MGFFFILLNQKNIKKTANWNSLVTMIKKKKIYNLTLILTFLVSTTLKSQVSIAPTNIFLEGNTRFGTYMVINNSNTTQEISIEFTFSYSETNEDGNRVLVNADSTKASLHSMASYIKAFPRNFTITPGQRQIVRIRVSPPNNLSDGTYWARIKTLSTPESPPLELQSNDAVAARVSIQVEQVTGLFYKTGEVSTGIDIQDINTEYDSNSGDLTVFTKFNRTGNSPFLGSITTSLLNDQGEELRRDFSSTSMYFDTKIRSDFNIDDLPVGTYTIRTLFETQRSDISNSDLVQMVPATSEIFFTKD